MLAFVPVLECRSFFSRASSQLTPIHTHASSHVASPPCSLFLPQRLQAQRHRDTGWCWTAIAGLYAIDSSTAPRRNAARHRPDGGTGAVGNRDANLAARIDRSARSTERDCGATSDAAPSRRSLISSTRHICAAELVLRRAYRDKECLSHSPFPAILIARARARCRRDRSPTSRAVAKRRTNIARRSAPSLSRRCAATVCSAQHKRGRAYVSATRSAQYIQE